MLTLFVVLICLLFVCLTGWTIATYFVNQSSQKLIKEEIKNLFDIGKRFFTSLKNLIVILATYSIVPKSNKVNSDEKNILRKDEKPLTLVQTIREIEEPSLEKTYEEDDDTALSSFSPEVVEVINEEEEKIA